MTDTAVVTGSSGFIGSHLVERLGRAGLHVIGIDRAPPIATTGAHLRADLSEPDDRVRGALREADVVFHLAGCPGVRDDAEDIEYRRWRDNVLAGEVVLREVPPSVTTVVVSSSSVYGGAPRIDRTGRAEPCQEDAPPRPRGGYARSKARLERRCEVRREAGGHVAVVRPFTVAGERQRADMAIAIWLTAARTGRALPVIGSLSRTRDVTDVRDVVEGLVRLAASGHATTLNLGTGRGRSLQELVHAVAAACRVPVRLDVHHDPHGEPTDTLADTVRCRQLLGFTPRTDLDELVSRQAAAMRDTEARFHSANELRAG